MKAFPKAAISFTAVAVAGVHIFVPSARIDVTTLILLVVAAVPWLLPYVKEFGIPGVVSISLRETRAATDKLGKGQIIRMKPVELKMTTRPLKVAVSEPKGPPFEYLRRVSETDPNLALVGFRMEIEKRIVRLAGILGIPTEHMGLQRLVEELFKRDVISGSSAWGLIELTALGNQAAHGAKVTREAAEWVLDVGPSILMRLGDIELPEGDGDDA